MSRSIYRYKGSLNILVYFGNTKKGKLHEKGNMTSINMPELRLCTNRASSSFQSSFLLPVFIPSFGNLVAGFYQVLSAFVPQLI